MVSSNVTSLSRRLATFLAVAALLAASACATSVGDPRGDDTARGDDLSQIDQVTPDAIGADSGKDQASTDGPTADQVGNDTTGTDTVTDDTGDDVPTLTCSGCHGSAANNAPPVDTKGNSSTTMPSVGAHQAHLTAPSGLATPLTCDQCHVVPATSDAAGHIDEGPAEVTFGALAKTGGANATWTHANASCATTYCHGATLKGGTVAAPTWTKVDDTQDACGACHGISPKTGRHPSNFGDHSYMGKNCTNCHNGTADATGGSVTNPTLHLNGAKDVALKSGGTWNAATKSCNPSCHGNEHW